MNWLAIRTTRRYPFVGWQLSGSLQQRFTVTASIQTFQLHFILVVGKTWVTKLQNAPCNDAKSITLKMQVAREIKFHIVHTYVVVRSLPF